jgi:hypothetical protein
MLQVDYRHNPVRTIEDDQLITHNDVEIPAPLGVEHD